MANFFPTLLVAVALFSTNAAALSGTWSGQIFTEEDEGIAVELDALIGDDYESSYSDTFAGVITIDGEQTPFGAGVVSVREKVFYADLYNVIEDSGSEFCSNGVVFRATGMFSKLEIGLVSKSGPDCEDKVVLASGIIDRVGDSTFENEAQDVWYTIRFKDNAISQAYTHRFYSPVSNSMIWVYAEDYLSNWIYMSSGDDRQYAGFGVLNEGGRVDKIAEISCLRETENSDCVGELVYRNASSIELEFYQ